MPATAEDKSRGIEGQNLSWRYRRNGPEILTGIDVSARHGLMLVEGENGTGKSTLLRLLATINPVQSGRLVMDGRDVSNSRERREARRSIGYLPQASPPVRGITVNDWIMYGAWLRELPKRDRRSAVAEVCDSLSLSALRRTKVSHLSVGQRRRADIARALVGWPSICIFDEPTAALDDTFSAVVRDLLVRHATDNLVIVAEHGDTWADVATATLQLKNSVHT